MDNGDYRLDDGNSRSHYSLVIQWSDEDQVFVVSFPEWGTLAHTHGETYEEALKNAQEVLDLMIESATERGETLPEPQLYTSGPEPAP